MLMKVTWLLGGAWTHRGYGAGDRLPRGMGRGLGYSPDHKWLGQGPLGATSSPVTLALPVGCPCKCETQAKNFREKGACGGQYLEEVLGRLSEW